MGLRNGCYATFFGSKPTRNGGEMVNLAVSRKDQRTGQYVTDFSGNLFLGRGVPSMANLPDKARVVVDEFDLKRSYDKATKVENYTITLWKWHVAEQNQGGGQPRAAAAAPVEDANELPF